MYDVPQHCHCARPVEMHPVGGRRRPASRGRHLQDSWQNLHQNFLILRALPFQVSTTKLSKFETLHYFVYHYFQLTENIVVKIFFKDFDNHL